MKNALWATLLALCIVGAVCGCAPAHSMPTDTRFTSISFAGTNGDIIMHYEEGMSPVLKSNCITSSYYHADAFEYQIEPTIATAVGVNLNQVHHGRMDVWVFAAARGVVGGGGVEVPPGIGGTLPNLTTLLTRARYSNTPSYQVTPAVAGPGVPAVGLPFWSYVDSVNGQVMRVLNFMFVP